MTPPRIVLTSAFPPASEAFSALGTVRVVHTPAELRDALPDSDILITRSDVRVDSALLAGTRVRFVGTMTSGADHVDRDHLRGAGITFAHAPGCNAGAVADYVTAALLVWSRRTGRPLRGMVLGVVGAGHTGSRVARRASALGMNVILHDPPLARATRDPVYRPFEALGMADVVSLHVPLTRTGPDATLRLFDARRLSRLKPGALLVNTARGEVVDGAALGAALDRETLGGAVLDVWEHEPDPDVNLLGRVDIGTAHIAGHSWDGKIAGVRMVGDALCAFLGVPPVPHSPVPEAGVVSLPARAPGGPQEVLARVVQAAYDIEEDDRLLRRILRVAPQERAALFSGLRASYRKRRDFAAWSVPVAPADADLGRQLSALGFRVS